MKEKEGTKLCKHCKTEIPAGAKVCPHCRKKQGMSGCLIVIIAFVVIIILLAIVGSLGGSSDETTSTNDNTQASVSSSSSTTEAEQAEEITYTAYTVSEMMSDLDSNPMNASNKYKDQYIEITGKLSVIDSDGKYISLVPDDDPYAILGVHCSIETEEQKEAVMGMTIGDIVTLRGKCTDVGEVLGYYLDIDSIG